MENLAAIGSIVGIVILACLLLTVIACGVIALFRGLKKSLGSMVVVVVSALFAALFTALLCKYDSAWVGNIVALLSGIDGMGDLMAVSAVSEMVSHYAVMLVKPFAFTILFFVFRLVFGILMRVFIKYIPILNNFDKKVDMLGGAGVGVVMGLVLAIIMMMPLLGTVNVVNTAVAEIEASADGELAEQISDIHALTAPVTERGAGKFMLTMGGKGMYNSLASSKYQGEKVRLSTEVENIAVIASSALSFTGTEVSEFGEAQTAAINKMADALDESTLLRGTVASVLAEASEKWLAGEQFMGMDKIDAGEMLEPVIDQLLVILQTSDKDNISSDIRTLANVAAILIDSGVLSAGDDYTAMLDKIGAEGVVSGVVSAIGDNERMAPMVDAITQMGIHALASAVGIPANAEERYDNLMGEIAASMNENKDLPEEEKIEAVKADVEGILKDYGIEVSDETADNISKNIISDLGDVSNLSGEDVAEFFALYAAASANKDQSAANRPVFDMLAAKDGKNDKGELGFILHEIVVGEDGSISVNGKTLKHYNAETYKESSAYKSGAEGVDFGGATSLGHASTVVSTIITAEEMEEMLGGFVEAAKDPEEAKKIEKVFTEVANAVQSMSSDESSATDMIESIGPVLDAMKETKTFGEEVTQTFFTAILQTETVSTQMGISRSEATDIAQSINESASTGSGYTEITTSVSNTVDVVKSVTDENITKEEQVERIETLMANMTPSSASAMKSIATESLLMNFGVPEEKSGVSANAAGLLFGNMASFKEDYPEATDEDFKREADAVNHVFVLAISKEEEGEDKKGLFNNAETGDVGQFEMSAADSLELLINSVVMTETLEDLVYGENDEYTNDPLESSNSIRESDKESMSAAIDDYYENHNSEEGVGRKLTSIGALFGIEKTFN